MADGDDRLVEFFYRCSDEEQDRLTRRQEGRNGAEGERAGQRLNRALLSFIKDVGDNGFSIDFSDVPAPESAQRKVRIPSSTVDQINAVVGRLPGVSRDQFVREALRRRVKAY